jgi:uncharacterized protein YigE (DUF2233 family)
VIWLVAACGGQPSSSQQVRTDAPAPACATRSFEGSSFTVCRYGANRDELRLAWKGRDGAPLRGFNALESELGSQVARLRFAMNAGMFNEEGAPIGLYVERGKQLKSLNLKAGPGNFHMQPNGVFAVGRDGLVSISPSAAFKAQARKPVWATQSGPMLLIDGKLHPRFDQDGESRLVRNGVGVKDPHTAFFVISEDSVSFGRFARFFRDALGCRNALFLDGSVSSLWEPASGRKDPSTQLGPLVLVLSRNSDAVQARDATIPKKTREGS